MSDEPTDLAAGLGSLRPKDKPPASARVLDVWIAQAERSLGVESAGRLGWLVATTVVTACLQRAVDDAGAGRFLLKGGTLLQHRLGLAARATRDLDGLVRGDLDSFLDTLDETLREDWGPLTLRRGPVEIIGAPTRLVKPRRFAVAVTVRGVTWRRVQVEIAADEGEAGHVPEPVAAPSLSGLGLPTPDILAGLAMRYQIAQKVHAVTDPHDPPATVNDRARDVVDLLLLCDLVVASGTPAPPAIRSAIVDVFTARAQEAIALGLPARTWPASAVALPHWIADYERAAASARVTGTLDEAVAQLNAWLAAVDDAR